jgi:hypothetical protein
MEKQDDNQMIDLEKGETLDTQITINTEDNLNQNQQNNKEEMPLDRKEEKKVDTQVKQDNESKSYIDKLLCVFNFIRPYFKITFNDIVTRIKKSFMPINNSFFDIAKNNPDLYGPFWIYTTLIYVIAAGGALSYYFTNSANNYFQMFIPVAGTILYSFGFGFPLALWLCMKCFKVELKYVSLICLYGYSLCCFIPVLIFCSSGFGWVQWLFLSYGIANSSAFLLINLWNLIRSLEDKKQYIFLGLLGGGQFILFLILKFYFFGSFKNTLTDNVIPVTPNEPPAAHK